MALNEIRIHFETEDDRELERLTEGIERLICPVSSDADHRCPNRWNIMTIELDDADAADAQGLLNER